MGFDFGDIMGGVSSGGSLIGGVYSPFLEREWNAKAARRAREFTREVMKNQIQWKTEDLKKAGLNPMLAYSTPASGAPNIQADVPDVDFGDTAGSIGRGVAVAKELRSWKIEKGLREEALKQEEARTRAMRAEAITKERFSEINALREFLNKGIEANLLQSQVDATNASYLNTLSNTKWTEAKTVLDRMRIPYSPEQVGSVKRMEDEIRGAVRRNLGGPAKNVMRGVNSAKDLGSDIWHGWPFYDDRKENR